MSNPVVIDVGAAVSPLRARVMWPGKARSGIARLGYGAFDAVLLMRAFNQSAPGIQ